MPKRVLAILLIVVGLLAIAGVLYWTFRPTIQGRVQPAPVVTNEPTSVQAPEPAVPPATNPPQRASSPLNSTEEQEQQLVRNRASAFVARQGSYTNADGFATIRDVYLDASATVRAFYQAEQQRLNQEHSLTKGGWTQTVRTLSSKITSDTPVVGKNQVTISVQAQQIVEAGATPAVLSYREFIVTLTREQGRWIVTRIESKPLDL